MTETIKRVRKAEIRHRNNLSPDQCQFTIEQTAVICNEGKSTIGRLCKLYHDTLDAGFPEHQALELGIANEIIPKGKKNEVWVSGTEIERRLYRPLNPNDHRLAEMPYQPRRRKEKEKDELPSTTEPPPVEKKQPILFGDDYFPTNRPTIYDDGYWWARQSYGGQVWDWIPLEMRNNVLYIPGSDRKINDPKNWIVGAMLISPAR